MSKTIKTLLALLASQLVITGLIFTANNTVASGQTPTKLVKLDRNALSSAKVIAGDDELTLSKTSGQWRLAQYPDLPLQSSKIKALTDELVNTEVQWPVTKTTSSHQRFQVSDDDFVKQLVLTDQHNDQQRILLGKSPSYKQLYVRNSDDDEVYNINFSAYQLSTDANDWLDKSLLAVSGVSKLTLPEISLEKRDDSWQTTAPSTLTAEQSLDSENIDSIVNRLTSLSVTKVVEHQPKQTTKLTVTNENNQSYTFDFSQDNDEYFIKRDDINHWFSIPKFTFEKLATLTIKDIVKQPKPTEEEAQQVSK